MRRLIFGLIEDIAHNPFEILQNKNITTDTRITDTYISIYNLFTLIGIIGVVVSLLWYGAKLALVKNGQARQEIKESYLVKVIIAIAIFSCVTILNIFLEIATSLV